MEHPRPSRRTPAVAAPGPRLAGKRSSASRADRGRPAADRRERGAVPGPVGRRRGVGVPSSSAPLGAGRRRTGSCGAGGLSPTKPATTTSSPSTTCCSATRRRTATACGGSRTSGGNDTSSASPPWPRLPSRSKRTRSAASAMLDDADFRAAARESRYLRDFADRTAGRAALYLGDLERCLELARGLCSSPSLLMAESAVRSHGRRRAARSRRVGRRRGGRGRARAPLQGSRHAGLGGRRDPSTRRCSLEGQPESTPISGRRTSIPAIRRLPTS